MSLGQFLRSRFGKEKMRAEGYFNRRKGRAQIAQRRYLMVGTRSYGAYMPLGRMERDVFCRFWGSFPIPGERATS